MNINRADIHTTTWSGPWDDPQPGNVQFTQLGNDIILHVPNIEEISTASEPIDIDTPLIERFRPPEDVWGHVKVRDDSDTDNSDGAILVRPDGTITIYADPLRTSFTGGGANTGFAAFSVNYVAVIVPGFDNQV